MEIWKAVFGYEGIYEVSTAGRVRSLDRLIKYGRQPNLDRLIKGAILTPHHRRYTSVGLHKEGKGSTINVHTLVLTAFVRARRGDEVARHLDGDTRNNRLENLCWGSSTENQFDRFTHGTACEGEKNYRAVLTEKKVKTILKMEACGSPKTIADTLDVKVSLVKQVLYGRSWNWLTGKPRKRSEQPRQLNH